jgi:hypothetical protein
MSSYFFTLTIVFLNLVRLCMYGSVFVCMTKDDSDTAIDGTLGHQFNKDASTFYWRILKKTMLFSQNKKTLVYS